MKTIGYRNGIPMRELGKTGVAVTMIGVGGFHMARHGRELGVRLIRAAISEGINMLDNAWCYHDGRSEEIMGMALRDGYREQAFLMTKNHGRDAKTFREQLGQSLERLQTDHIDLLQFHEIIHEGEPERIKTEGAIEEALKARDEGLIRFIGFTGHKWPRLLEEMLSAEIAWDTVQMPVNLLDAHYRSFADQVMPKALAQGIGVIGMKSLASGNLLQAGITPEEGIGYTLSQPVSTLITGIDSVDVLNQNLRIARTWKPLTPAEQQQLRDKVTAHAGDGRLEHYKTR